MYRIVICALLIISLFYASVIQANSGGKQRKFEFKYSAVLKVPEGAKSAAMWLPLPVSDAHQDITNLQINCQYPVKMTTDPEYGNAILYISAQNLAATTVSVELSFQALRREYVKRPPQALKVSGEAASDPLLPRWLQPDKLVPLNDRVRKLAAEVTEGKTTEIEKLRAIYDYAVNNLKYDKSGTGWGRGDIFFACDEKRGNCTDFHALIIGLCRASQIPARFQIGFSIPNDKPEGLIAGYHCWAEAYIKGLGWLPIDASEANKNPDKREYFFGAHDENRIQLSIGRDITLRPESHGQPLNYFIYPYAEIDGQPAPPDKLEKSFSYRNL